MITPTPDRIFVIIDVRDPLTRDKEFYNALKYSPYVNGVDEMSERNRRLILKRDRGLSDEDNVLARHFIIDVEVSCFGEFFLQFVCNPEQRRSLNFVDYDTGPMVPPNTDMDEIIEETMQDARTSGRLEEARASGRGLDEAIQEIMDERLEEFEHGLTHILKLSSGSKFEDHIIDRMLNDEDPGDDPDDDYEDDAENTAKPTPDAEPEIADAESAMDEAVEELERTGDFFIATTNTTVH